MTLNEHVATLFDVSVKLYCTAVTPVVNPAPGSCERLVDGVPEISVAVGSSQVIGFVDAPSSMVDTILLGHPLITGFVVSTSMV